MTAVLARILLRYLSGFLIAAGYLLPGTDLSLDPDLVTACGFVLGIAVETYYGLAKKYGWPT